VPQPVLTAHLFEPLHEELLSLLRGLSAEEWARPTVAGDWTVHDVAAHLLDTAQRRLSIQRDRYTPPLPFLPNAMNREWVVAMRRVSPRILLELLETYGRASAEHLASLDPFATAEWAVSWAGDEESPVWFDVARELTERWHHQQQIRDATSRPALHAPYLAVVIETFVRALPFTYRDVVAPEGTAVVVRITDTWSLLRDAERWRLSAGDAPAPATTITMSGDAAWRLFTKGLTRDAARAQSKVEGDATLAEPLFRTVAVIG
jgi:uncharacterized protein (TIGR03083 family)